MQLKIKCIVLFFLIFLWNLHGFAVSYNEALAYWNFNDALNLGKDATNTNHATSYGDVSYTSSGKFGGAASFDGTGDYLRIASTSFVNGLNAVSISAWIKPTSLTRTNQGIVYFSTGSGSNNLVLQTSGSTNAQIRWASPQAAWNPAYIDSPNSVISTGGWYFVVGVWNGTTAEIYINGQSVRSQTVNGNALSANGIPMNIGRYEGGTQDYSGLIDETAVWNRALTASEINELYLSNGTVPEVSSLLFLSMGAICCYFARQYRLISSFIK